MSPISSQYDEDFYAWTQAQAALLREEKVSDLDYENLAPFRTPAHGRLSRSWTRRFGRRETSQVCSEINATFWQSMTVRAESVRAAGNRASGADH